MDIPEIMKPVLGLKPDLNPIWTVLQIWMTLKQSNFESPIYLCEGIFENTTCRTFDDSLGEYLTCEENIMYVIKRYSLPVKHTVNWSMLLTIGVKSYSTETYGNVE